MFLVLITITTNLFANDKSSSYEQINYFGNNNCFDCIKINKLFSSSGLSYTYKNNFENKEELYLLYEQYNVPKEKYNIVPVVFYKDDYRVGFEEVENYIKILKQDLEPSKEEILSKESQIDFNDPNQTIEEVLFQNLTFLGIVLTGLLDGINPCSIAMLLFFLSLISFKTDKKGFNRKNMIFISLSYILGIFITYLLIGLGLYKFVIYLNLSWLRHSIFIVTIILTSFLAFLNLKDYFNIKHGKYENVKTQLPQNIKHKIHNILRNNNKSKVIILTTFISGVLVSLLEFFCTGQIYLPTINYMIINNISSTKAISYLLFYNFFFVLPLIIIDIIVYFTKTIINVSQLLVEKLHVIKILTFLFFTTATLILIIQYFSII